MGNLIRRFAIGENPGTGVFAISIVDEDVGGPAHRSLLLKFSAENKEIDFQGMTNEELEDALGQLAMLEDLSTVTYGDVPTETRDFYAGKQVVFGNFMIPWRPIAQVDQETGERYFGFFTPEDIEKAARVFSREGLGRNKYNFNHNKDNYVSEITLLEHEIVVDPARSKAASFGIIPPKGTWFGGLEIQNEKLFNSIGPTSGFSVETVLNAIAFERFSKS